MIDMASKQIIPAIIKYTKELADTVVAVSNTHLDVYKRQNKYRERIESKRRNDDYSDYASHG